MKRIGIFCILIFAVCNCAYSQKDIVDKICTACEYNSKDVVAFAKKLARKHSGAYNINQICDVYSGLYNSWSYVSTYKNEYIQSSGESVESLAGNCVEFAVLMSCLIHNIGGTTRIVLANPKKTGGEGHAYCEVYVCNGCDMQTYLSSIQDYYNPLKSALGISDIKSIHYHTDSKGGIWLNLDWQGQMKYPGGEYFTGDVNCIIYSDCTYDQF